MFSIRIWLNNNVAVEGGSYGQPISELCTFKFRNLIYSTKTWPSKSQRLEGAVILKIEKREQAAALGAQKAFRLFAPFMTFKCWCSTIFAFFQAQKSCNAKNCCNRKICSLCTTNWLTTLIVGFFLHHQFHSVLCLRRSSSRNVLKLEFYFPSVITILKPHCLG